jgi:exodeoxyribonuclease VIII
MKSHIMIDLETLGRRPGAAIVSIGAVAFDVFHGGTIGAEFSYFHHHVIPHPDLDVEQETLEWWAKRGGFPAGEHAVPLHHALADFVSWAAMIPEIETWWAWGATFDFPIIQEAADVVGQNLPWEYYQTTCARAPWRLAFGDRRHESRPHNALADARASVRDLREAVEALQIMKGIMK